MDIPTDIALEPVPSASGILRALLVDDDPSTGLIVKAAMKGEFQVVSETSGAEVVACASRITPDVILLDINMPNVDGYEVLRQLKLHPSLSAIPVICMSGDTTEASRKRIFTLGAVGYLRKPIDVRTLSSDLKALLNSMNSEMAQGPRHFVIAFNQAEKYRLIKETARTLLEAGKKVIVLSLAEGAEFCEKEHDVQIKAGRLTYLQIIPSLITKFPYLTELSAVRQDLAEFISGNLNDYVLIFDDPHLILNIKDTQSLLARVHSLKEMLCATFAEVRLFCTRETSPEGSTALNEMAAIFCR